MTWDPAKEFAGNRAVASGIDHLRDAVHAEPPRKRWSSTEIASVRLTVPSASKSPRRKRALDAENSVRAPHDPFGPRSAGRGSGSYRGKCVPVVSQELPDHVALFGPVVDMYIGGTLDDSFQQCATVCHLTHPASGL